MKSTLILDGLNCPNCANKIENRIKNDTRFENVEFNFINKNLTLEHNMTVHKLIEEIDSIVSGIESGITVIEKSAAHKHTHKDECEHCHSHSHEHEHGKECGCHSHEHDHTHTHTHEHGHTSKKTAVMRAAAVAFLHVVYLNGFRNPVVIIAHNYEQLQI